MSTSSHEEGSAVSTVVEAITADISARRVRPGERIVEAELARRFETSRGPVREALRHLAAQGLLEEHERRGWAVRRMSRDDVRELYQVREALEGQAAALAAHHVGDPAVRARAEQLRGWLKEFDGDLPRYVEELRRRDRFHDELAELSRNRLLQTMLRQLRPLTLQLQFSGFIFATRPADSIAEHVEILDAILAGDHERADRLTRVHIRTSRDVLLALPEDVFA
ncbi:GntR family transcriptional regulator [Conexibacter stalactiti]|uniref:GntR family transcriptional regulator n=1 Tax=Conexibacter stalactiti TaxID=1940611 RepID=A0ABU4HYX4_9ACTN|nr:GntR family transcriptional regulator [Conexibacter stalactiti]MDW5598423.1 GntR family transcriptional regulator [Conexibacter stalactiti]MEC5039065.1 GntR family transcriptional regulator [Conexibacter stalactiti]